MYGANEFEDGLGGLADGLGGLAAAAAGAATASPLPEAIAVEVVEGAEDAAPEVASAKQLKHRAAARAIVPGCAHWDVKSRATWPPGAVIPNADAMKWEVVQRDSTRRPAGWDAQKLCKWLHTTPVPPHLAPVPNPPEGESAPSGGTEGGGVPGLLFGADVGNRPPGDAVEARGDLIALGLRAPTTRTAPT